MKKFFVIGLGLVLSMGLILVNLGICQDAKPGDAKKPAVSSEGKAASPATKVPEQPKKESKKPATAATAPATPEKTADPGKLPGKFVPSEGC
ncbi:MAG: hypothetical protein NTY36_09460 [Deltaproteobacteria bacterium]|nr:hypothetical protein [Deltaproteobacteria bacterium]